MTHLPRTRNELETTLSDRLAKAKEAHAEITVRWNQVSNLRLLLAAIVVGLGFWWLRTGDATPGYAALGVAVLFLLVLVWHRRLGAQRAELATRATIRQQAMYRTDRDWRSLPDPPPVEISLDHPYALDLDLVGHGSLQHLIDTTQTPEGRQTLLAWLSNGADESEIAARQQVAQEFATADQWREDLQTAGLRVGQPAGSTGELLDWLEQAGAGRIGFRHRFAIALAVGTIVVAVLYVSGGVAFAWLLPFFVANGILTFATSGAGELSKINSHQRSLTQYRAVLPVAERAPGAQPEVARLRSDLSSPSGVASRQLTVLDRALALVIPPGTIIWFPLQVAVNWDLLVEARLRRLATSIGPHIRRWIATVGQIEALAALGDAAALNPDWTWPVVSAGSDSVDGRMLGHPLLSADRRVANDVKVGPAGKVLIVTGSNMAGKSTLLRTIGLNAVLARAGGPVCAESLTMPGLPVWSSVRIQDSLEQGVSLYMAELIRLKQIVDAAKAGPILYLLDEILHGTNTTERRIAARAVIRQLIDAGAIGAVSTHDLELVDAGLDEAAVCVHLVDQVVEGPGGPEMVFDYKVRPGLAPSSNALRLLKLVGLGDGSVT